MMPVGRVERSGRVRVILEELEVKVQDTEVFRGCAHGRRIYPANSIVTYLNQPRMQ
jgi:hypothetical protein